jgi:DNA sulfur modification protein DndE
MTTLVAQQLMNTTLTSSVATHQRLKNLSATFGCSEDLVSRYAIGVSLREGPIPQGWEPSALKQNLTVLNGKSIRGKTMFKDQLPLFLVMLAMHEPEAESDDVRALFTLHWERGVEFMANSIGDLDWLEFLTSEAELLPE